MRYSAEPKFRKYVKEYGFLSFARKFGDKYVKQLMDTATKTGIDTPKTASKWVVQKTAEATRDLVGNKMANKITDERQEIYIPSRKKTRNFWWLDFVLTPDKNGIAKDNKLFRHSMW